MIVQIDESLFKGKHKYNGGRFQCGDIRPNTKNEESEKYSDDTKGDNNKVGAKIMGHVTGLWVFGHFGITLFIIEKLDKETLLPTVKNEVELGIYIVINGELIFH